MPHRHLPHRPNLRHLRNQARDLIQGHAASAPAALQRIREFHPEFERLPDDAIAARPFRLADAQLTVAREYRFESWPRLRASIDRGDAPDETQPIADRIHDPVFRAAVACIDSGDVNGLRRLLLEYPSLARQRVYFNASRYFGQPGLLQFVAQNPIRQESMPHAVEIAHAIIEAGASETEMTETLTLVATGCVPRECDVQIALIDLLCAHGAQIGGLRSVLAHGEFAAAEAMLRHGGKVTLPVAAALNISSEFDALLPEATPEDRHLALAFAAQFGRTEILRRLLAAGEDPNRYNPPGAHAHSTPLHQAAVHGQVEAVTVLLAFGARTDIPDTLFNGTARGWAEHADLPEMVTLLATGASG